MAWQDVPPEPFTPSAPFVTLGSIFQKIGDKFDGIYEVDADGTFGRNFTFNTAAGRLVLTLKGQLLKQVQKAQLKPGSRMALQFRESKDIGKENPMKVYKLLVDHDYKGPAPKNGPNVVIPAREAPGVAPAPAEDDPFA